MPSVSAAHKRALPYAVTHIHAPLYLRTFKYCWASFLRVPQHSECHAVASVTLPMPSLFQYPSPPLHSLFTTPAAFIASLYICFFITSALQSSISSYNSLRPFISLFCFPLRLHISVFTYSSGWKLNCDPAHRSILEAVIWECIGIHCGVFAFGSISVMFMIQHRWTEKYFLRCPHLLCAPRAAAQRCSAASRYKNWVALHAMNAQTILTPWKMTGGEAKPSDAFWESSLTKGDILWRSWQSPVTKKNPPRSSWKGKKKGTCNQLHFTCFIGNAVFA